METSKGKFLKALDLWNSLQNVSVNCISDDPPAKRPRQIIDADINKVHFRVSSKCTSRHKVSPQVWDNSIYLPYFEMHIIDLSELWCVFDILHFDRW